MPHQAIIRVSDPRHQGGKRVLQHRLVDHQIRVFREIGKLREIPRVAGEYDVGVILAKRQCICVDEWRMQISKGGDLKTITIKKRPFFNHMKPCKRTQVRAPLVLDPKLDVRVHGLQEPIPIGLKSLGPPDFHGRFKSRGPGGVQERAKFQIVVRMQMGDEDQFDRLQLNALIDQTTRHSQTAIHNNAAPIKNQQAGRWIG